MKNKVTIDIDTERTDQIQFIKSTEYTEPTTIEEGKTMIDLDIITLTQGLCELIHFSSLNSFGDKSEYQKYVIDELIKLNKEPCDSEKK